jgi:hypothetical protein
MSQFKLPSSPVFAAGVVTALLLAGPVAAQPGSGMMMGPGMGSGMMGRAMCSPRAAGFAEWRIERIERAVQPTEAQRGAFNDLKAASAKAVETMAAACPRDVPQTATARLEAMEKRLEAMLAAVKTVRPAFDAFYASLTSEQKTSLDRVGPRHWRWPGWRWGQGER